MRTLARLFPRGRARAASLIATCALLVAPDAAAQSVRIIDSLPPEMIVAARTMPRGHVLSPGDLAVGPVAPSAFPVGWVTKRVVREGEPLRPPAIGRAPVVQAGATVNAVSGTRLVRVVRRAVAVGEGAHGDTILVRVARQAAMPAVVVDSSTVTFLPPPIR